MFDSPISYLFLGMLFFYFVMRRFVNTEKSYPEITAAQLEPLLEDKSIELIDVRSANEMASGVIGNPHKIELNAQFGENAAKLDPSKNYVVYCRSGRRSALATKVMMKKGFESVSNLKGGILAWNSNTN